MRTLDFLRFDELLAKSAVQPRLKQELKFETSSASLPDDWSDFELIAIADRTQTKGVLLVQPYDEFYIVQYELVPLTASSTTGRARSIICDFCYTWQRGSNAGSITLHNRETKRAVRFLCCGDLNCSRNVRTLTEAARISRTQLRESLDDTARVDRLKQKLSEKMTDLAIAPIE